MVTLIRVPAPEGIKHEQPNTRVVINDRTVGTGTLFITESRVIWSESSSGQGFSIEYPHINLIGISKDLNSFPEECLYLNFDNHLELEGIPQRSGSGSEDEGEEEDINAELRFVPADKTALNVMYNALTECQALHPDPNDSISSLSDNEDDEEDEDEGYADFNGANGDYSHQNGVLDMEVEGQFDDAES